MDVGLENFFDALEGGLEEIWELLSFFGGKFAKNEFGVADFLANCGIISADAEARKIASVEGCGDGFEAIITTAGAFGAVANLAEIEIKIIADDENIGEG